MKRSQKHNYFSMSFKKNKLSSTALLCANLCGFVILSGVEGLFSKKAHKKTRSLEDRVKVFTLRHTISFQTKPV
jgi:hypothetical protein